MILLSRSRPLQWGDKLHSQKMWTYYTPFSFPLGKSTMFLQWEVGGGGGVTLTLPAESGNGWW